MREREAAIGRRAHGVVMAAFLADKNKGPSIATIEGPRTQSDYLAAEGIEGFLETAADAGENGGVPQRIA